MTSHSYDTIVIGLGASGVAASTTLARAGKKVLGLEAQDRIGGRVRTVPFGDGIVELGAEWIHGEKANRVFEIATKNKVRIKTQDLVMDVFYSDGSIGDKALVNELIGFCLALTDKIPERPEPLGSYITGRLKDHINASYPHLLKDMDFINEFLIFMNLLVNNYESSNDWDDVSAHTRYEELDGHQHYSWHRNGYKTLFEILLNKFGNGAGFPNLDIKLNCVVTQICWPQNPNSKVVVKCTDETVYEADNVIITMSIGVLKESYETLFIPQLPLDKIAAIQRIPIGVMNKILLTFSQPWWPKDQSFFAFIWRTDDRKAVPSEDYWTTRIFGASRPMGADNVLTLWTSGEVAKLVETLLEDVVKSKLRILLQKFMGAKLTVPEPTGIIRSTWYSNPYTRGSYSYDNHLVAEYPQSRAALAQPLLDAAGKPRVLFAGEATDETHFSTVHGAIDTGLREARRLLTQTSKL